MPRETYTVKFRDGHEQSFDGPPGMSDADVKTRARQERKFQGGDIATTEAGGYARHVFEDEPGTVSALLGGAATFGGPAAVGAVPFVTTGLKRLSQLLATGHADPVTTGELATDAAEGAVGAFGGPAIKYGAQKIGAARTAVQGVADRVLPRGVTGAIARFLPKAALLDAATSKPVLGAAEEIGDALTPRAGLGRLRDAASGLTPGVEAEAASPGLSEMVRRRSVQPSPAMRAFTKDRASSLDTAKASLHPTGTGTPTSAATPGAGYDQWLGELGEAATPPQAGELAWPASRAPIDDLPNWQGASLRAPATPSPLPAGELAWPASRAPIDDLPSWQGASLRAPATPPPGELGAVTGWPAQPPSTGADYPAWLRSLAREAGEAAPTPQVAAPMPATPQAPPPQQGPAWMRANSGTSFSPMAAADAQSGVAARVAPAVETPLPPSMQAFEAEAAATPPVARSTPADAMPRSGTQDQFAQWTPEARAARAAERASAVDTEAPVTDEQQTLLDALLNSPSFRALRGAK